MTAIAAIAPFEKACKKCGEVKPLDKFPKCSAARDGREGTCGPCKWVARACKLTSEQRERQTRRVREWKRSNSDRWRETKRAQDERRRRRDGARPLGNIVAEAIERRNIRRVEREAAKAGKAGLPWHAKGLSAAEKFRTRYREDPEFNLRQRIRASFKRKRQGLRLGDLLRAAVAREGASPTAEAFIGYAASDLREHLQRQFTKGMTWPRFCAGEIHIDHIVPLAAFDLSNVDELRAAWALPNLRPIWAAENLAKAGRRVFLI